MTRESVTIDSDDELDVELDVEMKIDSMSGSGASGASGSSKRKDFNRYIAKGKKQKTLQKKKDDASELYSSLNAVRMEFGKVFDEMNGYLGVMVQVWGGEEERKKGRKNLTVRATRSWMK